MDTAARNTRADRIHRLWMRATGNFREAHFARAEINTVLGGIRA